jgi:hypothetical protein
MSSITFTSCPVNTALLSGIGEYESLFGADPPFAPVPFSMMLRPFAIIVGYGCVTMQKLCIESIREQINIIPLFANSLFPCPM